MKTKEARGKPYKVFHDHIKAHFEREHPDWKVQCKICGKDIDQIYEEYLQSARAKKGDFDEQK